MADMGKTEIAATVEEMVSAVIQQQLIEQSKLIPTVQSFAAGPGIDKIKIPRAGNFTVDDKVENTAVTPQVQTYATDDMNLDKYKVIQVLLEDNATLQAKPDIVRDVIERMGRQLALQIDNDLYTQLQLTSAAAPDHRIAYANATDLGQADILEARALLHEQNVPFSECRIIVSPRSEKALLAIADFVHADKYGNANGLQNGELGKLYGASVIMTNVADDLKTLVYHPSHCAFARQMNPKFESDRQLDKLADLYSISQLYGMKVLDSGVRGVLLGTAI